MARAAYRRGVTIVRAPAPIVRVQAPRAPMMVRARRYAHLAGRGGRVAIKKAWEEKHTIAAVGAAAALGFAKRQNVALPHIDALGTAGTYGVAAWAAGKYLKSHTLSHVATGLLCVAAYQLSSGGGVSGADIDLS